MIQVWSQSQFCGNLHIELDLVEQGANQQFMDWMRGCDSIASNCSTYWRGRDGASSIRYDVTHVEPTVQRQVDSSSFTVIRTRVANRLPVDEWTTETQLRSRFATFYAKQFQEQEQIPFEKPFGRPGLESIQSKLAQGAKHNERAPEFHRQRSNERAGRYAEVVVVLMLIAMVLVGGFLVVTAPTETKKRRGAKSSRMKSNGFKRYGALQ